MADAEGMSPTPGALVPAAAESPRTGRRIRLSKALAAMARAKSKEGDSARPREGSRRCRLTQAEEAMLGELKQRLRKMGVDLRKGELLRAGLYALANFDDSRLQEAVAQLDGGSAADTSQSVS